jgi:hypothetical protein
VPTNGRDHRSAELERAVAHAGADLWNQLVSAKGRQEREIAKIAAAAQSKYAAVGALVFTAPDVGVTDMFCSRGGGNDLHGVRAGGAYLVFNSRGPFTRP